VTKVKCTVNRCEFWSKDQVCLADEIWVKNDITGDPDKFAEHFINANMEEFSIELNRGKETKGPMNDGRSNSSAQTTPQTCCDTMRPKKETSCECGSE
jgi:hypothetical protein